MSDDIAIRVEGLGKRYRYGQTLQLTRTFRETLMSLPAHLARKARRALPHRASKAGGGAADPDTPPGTFWALRDVSFEVRKGETVGIIGRNGAGKSTLLKILSRITMPTAGRAEIQGRLSSLLEVGTGFHPELTGRENVYLNGAILGMRRAEINRKFDEIVAFAEVERFLDTPVKRYSSGMLVRLAFAVAAHLEPEILVVDEVLAVGDAEFQKKCLGKMDSVALEGRTVLFVSHNMQAVRSMCQRGILIREGRIAEEGTSEAIVSSYLDSCQHQVPNVDIPPEMHRVYPPGLEVHRVEILNSAEEFTTQVLMDETFSLRIHHRIHRPDRRYFISASLMTMEGVMIASTTSTDGVEQLASEEGCSGCLRLRLRNILSPGNYMIEIKVKSEQTLVDLIDGIPLSVAAVSAGSRERVRRGLVQLSAEWDLIDA
jgi:lipopolysaccharide transport system ATP-binding protein